MCKTHAKECCSFTFESSCSCIFRWPSEKGVRAWCHKKGKPLVMLWGPSGRMSGKLYHFIPSQGSTLIRKCSKQVTLNYRKGPLTVWALFFKQINKLPPFLDGCHSSHLYCPYRKFLPITDPCLQSALLASNETFVGGFSSNRPTGPIRS